MDRKTFAESLRRATAEAHEFASRFVTNFLPDDHRYVVFLNQSYDGNPLADGEIVFPHDPMQHRRCSEPLNASEVIGLLWREGSVPEWIDISVKRVVESQTYFQVLCCGRFTARDDLLYYRWTDHAPFGVKGPILPRDWSEKHGRFDLHSKQIQKPGYLAKWRAAWRSAMLMVQHVLRRSLGH